MERRQNSVNIRFCFECKVMRFFRFDCKQQASDVFSLSLPQGIGILKKLYAKHHLEMDFLLNLIILVYKDFIEDLVNKGRVSTYFCSQ